MILRIILMIVFLYAVTFGDAQDKYFTTVGLSFAKPDIRNNFLEEQYSTSVYNIAKMDDPTLDNEYIIGLGVKKTISNKFILKAMINSSLIVNDFSIPIKSRAYFDAGNKLLYTNLTYINLNLSPNLELSAKVLARNTLKVFVGANVGLNTSYYKHFNEDLRKFAINMHSMEIFPTINICNNKIGLNIDYRILNLKYKDESIANNGKNTEFYNTTKVRIRFQYYL